MTQNLATSDIVALAFVAMEKTPPASFDDDSEEAVMAARFYPSAMQRCLEANDWSFASVYAQLPPLTPEPTVAVDPTMPWIFRLPGDCLRVREVVSPCPRWRVDRAGLRASVSGPLDIRYTARDLTESQLPATFRQAVALQLAILAGPKFLGTQSKLEAIRRDFSTALEDAKREDSRTASEARYDGLPDQGDWADEAVR